MDMNTLDLLYWHWWLIGIVLFIVEMMVPATFFLWMGVSALAVGVISFVAPEMAASTEIIIFAILSVISVVAWRKYQQSNPTITEQPTLNRRGEQYIGRVITLTKPIKDGFGKEKVGATLWTLQGPDAEIGSKVKITGMESAVLLVELQ